MPSPVAEGDWPVLRGFTARGTVTRVGAHRPHAPHVTAGDTRHGAEQVPRPEAVAARGGARARPLRRPPHHRPGRDRRAHRRLAARRRTRAHPAGGLPLPGEDHPLRPRAHPRAGGARPGCRGVRLLRALRLLRGVHPGRLPPGPRRAHPGLRPLLHRAGAARLRRHRARRARLRDEVLHQRGQLRLGGQQLPGLLHPGRHQVPGLRARGEDGAAQRDPHRRLRPRHPLGLRLAPAGDAAHHHVADVRPGHPAQLPHDAGLRGAHLPVRRRRGQGHLRQVPLEAEARRPLAGLGRGPGSDGPRPRLQPARPLGHHRGRPVPRVGTGRAARARGGRAQVRLRPPRRHEDHPGGAGPRTAHRPHGARPQPGQLLRRDRADRLLHRQRRARHRLHQRPAAPGPELLLPGHPAHPARRPQLRPHPGQPAGGRRPQQPARRLPPGGDPPGHQLLAQLAGRRLPRARLRGRGRLPPPRRTRRRRQDPQAQPQLRRPLHAGRALLALHGRLGEAAHRRRLPLRTRQGGRRAGP